MLRHEVAFLDSETWLSLIDGLQIVEESGKQIWSERKWWTQKTFLWRSGHILGEKQKRSKNLCSFPNTGWPDLMLRHLCWLNVDLVTQAGCHEAPAWESERRRGGEWDTRESWASLEEAGNGQMGRRGLSRSDLDQCWSLRRSAPAGPGSY